MSGRGRGRGQGPKTPIPMSSLGMNRQELAQHQNVLTPPELYPPTFFRAIKIEPEEVDLFLVGVKRQFRNELRNSQFYIKEKKDAPSVERYSDKYETILSQQPSGETKVWNYDLFPDELKPKLKGKPAAAKAKKVTFDDLKSKLEKLESTEKENENEEAVEDEEKEKENEEEIEAGVVEEDIEEETDYAMSYFDNGEDYLNDSDNDLGDEATF